MNKLVVQNQRIKDNIRYNPTVAFVCPVDILGIKDSIIVESITILLTGRVAILESATNLWLLVLSIFHKKRIIKQASQSQWVAEYNLKVLSAWDL